jgi:hypothetical protein
MLNLFQHLSGQLSYNKVQYFYDGVPKQVRHDLGFYTLITLSGRTANT